MKECTLYKKQKWKDRKNKTVQCTACEHRCNITEGSRGICGVRKNIGGKLFLLVYGRVTALNNDPIEKKPLFHFLPNTTSMSIGTVGCNFRCAFCQNWDISQAPKGEGGEERIVGREMSPKEIVEEALKNGSKSISYTYNEPAIFAEFCHDTAVLAVKAGLKNVYVTSGFETKESMEYMKGLIDAMNIDLKSFSEKFYKELCGTRLAPVLETIKRAHETGIWVEITTLVIPEENDSDEELKKIAEFIYSVDGKGNVPWHISRFFPLYKMQDKSPTPIETLEKAYKIGKKAGLKYVYVGNVPDDNHSSTVCPNPKCGKAVVERSGYKTGKINIKDGKCECGEEIAGRW